MLFSVDFNMNPEFTTSFVRDLINGTTYLHESAQMAHGSLNTRSCLITNYWTLKLSDYGLNEVMNELATKEMIQMDEVSDVLGATFFFPYRFCLLDLLHVAPELIEDNHSRMKSVYPATFAGDMYAIGCLLFEICYREPLMTKEEIVKHPSEYSTAMSHKPPSLP